MARRRPSPLIEDQASVIFYSIDACGYYRRNASTPEFGGLPELVPQLLKWVNSEQQSIVATQTFEPDRKGNYLQAYCYQACRLSDNSPVQDIIVTLWMRSETIGRKVGSVLGASPPGDADVLADDVKPGYIPGIPAYFWIIPAHHAFAVLKLKSTDSLNHQAGFRRYLSGYLTRNSQYVRLNRASDQATVIGYAASAASPLYKPRQIFPRFATSRLKFPGNDDAIRSRREKITKVIYKTVLKWDLEKDRSLLNQLMNYLQVRDFRAVSESEFQFRSEIAMTPTAEQLEEILEGYDAENSWEDVGFEFSGFSGHQEWLSHTYHKLEIPVRVEKVNEVITGQSLGISILEHRSSLIADLRKSKGFNQRNGGSRG